MASTDSHTVHVYDTQVKGRKGILYFDVMTTDEAAALTLARRYLATSSGEAHMPVTLTECRFCHSEPLVMFSIDQQPQFRDQVGFIVSLSV